MVRLRPPAVPLADIPPVALEPVLAPPKHPFGHVAPAPHCPLSLQVASCLSVVHTVAPGPHSPAHAPATHAWVTHFPDGEWETRSGPH